MFVADILMCIMAHPTVGTASLSVGALCIISKLTSGGITAGIITQLSEDSKVKIQVKYIYEHYRTCVLTDGQTDKPAYRRAATVAYFVIFTYTIATLWITKYLIQEAHNLDYNTVPTQNRYLHKLRQNNGKIIECKHAQ